MVALALVWLAGLLGEPEAPSPGPAAIEDMHDAPEPTRLRGRGEGRVVPPDRPEPDTPAPAPLPPGLRFDERSVEGATPFQRRLSVGAWLGRLDAAVGRGETSDPQVRRELARPEVQEILLRLDAWKHMGRRLGGWGPGDEGRKRLRCLVDPPRDVEGLVLSTTGEPFDALGSLATLRVWTRNGAHPPDEVAAGEHLLEQLGRVVGDASPFGYDVYVGPRLGGELFPDHPMLQALTGIAGLYTIRDELSLVKSGLAPRFRTIVLKHELVHAWSRHWIHEWRSRFVEEGLAEYLSRLTGTERELAVRSWRLRDNYAALLRILERFEDMGVRIRSVPFARLAANSPPEQYALGHLGYLLAQAAIAYVGPDVVVSALEERSEKALLLAVGAIRWPTFLAWLGREAQGGTAHAAQVVTDVGPVADAEDETASSRYGRLRRTHFRRMGIVVPRSLPLGLLGELTVPPALSDIERERAFRGIADTMRRAGERDVVLVADDTQEMTVSFRSAPLPPGVFDEMGEALGGARTRSEAVERLHRALLRARSGLRVPVYAWGATVARSGLPLSLHANHLSTSALLDFLRERNNAATVLIACIASDDRPSRATEETLRLQMATDHTPIRDVLIVDLAGDSRAARDLAAAFARHLGSRGRVVYWDPQKPLR